MVHHRIQPTIAALGIAAVVFVCLSAFCYRTGRAVDTESRFFDPGRAPDFDEALCACKIEYALHSREANDVVFIGDSSGCDGVDPITFERASGHRAYNLCSEARLGPVGYLATLEAYLRNHPRPKGVVLCVTPITFEWPLGFMGEDIANHFIAHYGHEVGMFSARQDVAYFAQFGAASWLSARRTDDVRDLPLTSLETETYRSFQRRVLESRGWCKLPEAQGAPAFVIDHPGSPICIAADWDSGVRRIRAACAARGVVLFVRFMPLESNLKSIRDFGPLIDWARRFESEQGPGVVVVTNPTLLWYDHKLVWDSLHLNAAGAAKFSEDFGLDLRRNWREPIERVSLPAP
jgi:hypothetical protein